MLNVAIARALDEHEGLQGVACVDVRSGVILVACARDAQAHATLDLAVYAAAQLCAPPSFGSASDDGDDEPRAGEALVVSDSAVHAFARAKRHPEQVIVGVARGGANVALLLASVRSVAEEVR